MSNVRELRDQRATLLDLAKSMSDKVESENREMYHHEEDRFNALMRQVEGLNNQIETIEQKYPRQGRAFIERQYNSTLSRSGIMSNTETRALAAYVRGDRSALQDLDATNDDYDLQIKLPSIFGDESRAVDSTMNITTAADGLNAVPTGFAGMVAARMSEVSLAERLGVRKVPGKGTTVDFPYENADPNEFASTSEQNDAHGNNYQRDAAVMGKKSFTLAKKTKKLELTEELLDDEDVNLMSYIADHIGRAIALTQNSMLLTEIAANGTSLKTFASASAIAAGELEEIVFHDTLGYYLDEGKSVGWVMRPSTNGAIKSITGNSRLYDSQTLGSNKNNLLEFPVHYSRSAGAIGSEAKSVYFGNWYYVGMRQDPALRLIRDPYTVDGLVILKYSFRAVFGVLIAGAIGYGVHSAGSS